MKGDRWKSHERVVAFSLIEQQRIQGRPRSLTFEHGELLAQSEDLQGCVASRTEENAESTQHSEEQMDHELMVVARRANSMPRYAQTIDFTMR
jgi:hypothetical protein